MHPAETQKVMGTRRGTSSRNHKWRKVDEPIVLGQSGTHVRVVADQNGGARVVKTWPTRSSRMLKQYDKHVAAQDGFMAPLRVPTIESECGDLGYTMTFVSGVPLGVALDTCTAQEAAGVGDILCEYLTNVTVMDGSHTPHGGGAQLIQRLHQLRRGASASGASSLLRLIDHAIQHVADLDIPPGWNHGDLSLENLLLAGPDIEVWAIDFLDAPFDTPLIDWGRLWLDLRYGWWGAGYWPSANWQLNAAAIARQMTTAANDSGLSRDHLDTFAALAIARVVPYTTNPVRLAYLKVASQRILGGE